MALFIGLGGGAYAALKLPSNSVGSKQLKANAVNASKVKDGSLAADDFKGGQLPAGAQGPQGLPGAQGVKGDKGDPCPPSDPACKGPKGDPGAPATNAAHADSADTATNAGNADTLDNKDSTAFALAGAEPWHDAPLLDQGSGAWCHWVNFGADQNQAGYFRDSAGVVHLRGLVAIFDQDKAVRSHVDSSRPVVRDRRERPLVVGPVALRHRQDLWIEVDQSAASRGAPVYRR